MYWNNGSPLAKGKFHWELYNVKPENLSDNPKLDWETLRDHIKIYGARNSLTIALMPTATTSQFLGNNECFEPYTSNIYKRKTLAGEFIVINKYLIHDLYRLGIWNDNIKNYLLICNGSIQNINGIPDELKYLYKTSWEIDQLNLIKQAADRQPFVDQAQSLNLYVEDLSLDLFNKLMFKAWKSKLKTGKYYLHTRPGAMPQAFTIDPEKQKDILSIMATENKPIIIDDKKIICDSCSA
jgi:ribonucleoside-diphosphate reductase alpha chain